MTILRRLLPSQDTDALLGDIAEEYAGGRSALWYGLQILAAIVIGSWKAVRANKGVALGAIAAGFGFQMAFGNGLLLARIAARHAGYPTTWIVTELLQISSHMLLGWSLVRLYRSYGITMLFAFRVAMLAFLLMVFVWSATPLAMRADTAMLVMQAAHFRSAVVRSVFESIVMLVGGYLATRRTEAA